MDEDFAMYSDEEEDESEPDLGETDDERESEEETRS